MRKISSHEGWYPRNVDFKNRQNRILRGTFKRWFHETAEIEFSCTKMRKICSFESCYIRKIFSHEACKRIFHDWSKSHFKASNMKIISTLFSRYLETLISRIGRTRIFRLPKCGKFLHTKRGTLQPSVSRLGQILIFLASIIQKTSWRMQGFRKPWVSELVKNRNFMQPICGKFADTKLGTCRKLAHTKVGTQETWISRIGKIAFWEVPSNVGFTKRQKSNFHAPKCGKFAHSNLVTFGKLFTLSLVPLKRVFHDWFKLHFKASNMKIISTLFSRYLETLISRIGSQRILRQTKCGKLAHT